MLGGAPVADILRAMRGVDAELQLWGAVLQVHAAQQVLLQLLYSRI